MLQFFHDLDFQGNIVYDDGYISLLLACTYADWTMWHKQHFTLATKLQEKLKFLGHSISEYSVKYLIPPILKPSTKKTHTRALVCLKI